MSSRRECNPNLNKHRREQSQENERKSIVLLDPALPEGRHP